MTGLDGQKSKEKLESWKKIAAFFDRDERTVHRWEKELGLPVHRLPGVSKGRVYAYSDELALWSKRPKATTVVVEAVAPRVVEVVAPVAVSPAPETERTRRWVMLALMAGIVSVALAGTEIWLKNRRSSVVQNREAEELYLKGRYYWSKRTPESLNQAVDSFTQAIVREPKFALAYVGLADCYNLLREYSAMPDNEAYPRALAAAQRAVELEDSLAEAHNSLAFVLFWWRWDAIGAEREFRRAIELNPNYGVAHHWHATFLLEMGRFPEALTEMERAQKLDPASASILADEALILYRLGRRDEAIAQLKQIEDSDRTFLSSHRYLWRIYLELGDYPSYLRELKESALRSKDPKELALSAAGEKGFATGGARGMLESTLEAEKQLYAQGLLPAMALACTSSRLGNRDEALRYLEASFERHELWFHDLLVQPALESLHPEPRFQVLKAKLEHRLSGG